MRPKLTAPSLRDLFPDTVLGRSIAIAAPLAIAVTMLVGVAVWQVEVQRTHLHDSRASFDVTQAIQTGAVGGLYADTLTGRYIVTPSADLETQIHQTEQGALDQFQTARDLEAASSHPSDLQDFDQLIQNTKTAFLTHQLVIDEVNAGNSVMAGQLLLQGLDTSQANRAVYQNILAGETAEVHDAAGSSEGAAISLIWVLVGAIVILTVGGTLATMLATRALLRPLHHLRETARIIGEGDLHAAAEVSGPREVRELATVLNRTTASLHEQTTALTESEERLRRLVENSHDLILVIGPDRKVVFVNQALESMFGYKVEEWVGRDAMAHLHPDDARRAGPLFAKVAAGLEGPTLDEAQVRRADGTYAYMQAIISRIPWNGGHAILLNARDISQQKAAQETIAFMAYHDPLTGLPNRLLLQDRLEVAVAQARRGGQGVCVVSLDLDRFKNVNDLLGHNAGDELLKQVANRLNSLVREGDTVARIGGDEFILVFPECGSIEIAKQGTQRVVEGFRRPFRIVDHEIHVTASAGLARYPDHGSDGEALINNADLALYVVKENGRNGCRLYTHDLNTRNGEWFTLESAFRKAIVNGEIVVYYQPQMSVSTGDVIGAEALVRWNHPERGIIPPSDFIPLAEETGLISLLGEVVLHDACVEALTWPDHLRVAVNVSLRQFEKPDFVERMLAIVHETGLPPDRLELEITESTALRDVELTREIATRLTDAGVHLSIDDFGTGNTSLRHLQKLPLHQVKIDQSFIFTLNENPANAAIAASVISLGHKLNLNVIAEGVETEEQLEFLREQHCDEFQGFLVSKPVPGDEFRRLIAARAAPVAASDPA